ncbi:GatB/YqeY domain-containing protein [Patescibacteria group bacterium]|nr:GatB/YqeY domain-containing protein [Patescibacteria group bacterium]
MNLKDQIQSDLTAAMKAKEDLKLQTLRMLSAALHNEEIAKGDELDESTIHAVIRREVKKRKEAAESFRLGGRTEQSDKEEAEGKILEVYLPQMMDEAAVAKIVEEEVAANPDAQMGQIIGAVIKRTAGNADGAVVSKLVNQKFKG